MKRIVLLPMLAMVSAAFAYNSNDLQWDIQTIQQNQRNAEWQRGVLEAQNAELIRQQQELIRKQEELKAQQAQAAKDAAEQRRQIIMRQNAALGGGPLPLFTDEIRVVCNGRIVLAGGEVFRVPGNVKFNSCQWKKGDTVDVYDNSENDGYRDRVLVNVTKGVEVPAVKCKR